MSNANFTHNRVHEAFDQLCLTSTLPEPSLPPLPTPPAPQSAVRPSAISWGRENQVAPAPVPSFPPKPEESTKVVAETSQPVQKQPISTTDRISPPQPTQQPPALSNRLIPL